MPRFFFDFSDGNVHVPDVVGTNFSDRMAAREEALGILSDLGRNELPDGDHRRFSVTVRDETRATIYAAELVVSGRWLAD